MIGNDEGEFRVVTVLLLAAILMVLFYIYAAVVEPQPVRVVVADRRDAIDPAPIAGDDPRPEEMRQ